MSYNTRRGPQNSTPQQVVGGIGTRRPVVTNNFVSGGQLNPQQQQQKMQQQQQQRAPQQQQQQQQNTGIQFRNQQQTPTPAQLKQQPITPIKKEPQTPQAVTPQAQQPVAQDVNMSADDSMEGGKKFWKGRPRPILSKEERTRRRNFRLSKMLQPKNALMILNELVKNVVFSVEDYPTGGPDAQYKAVANCEGIEHTGYGKSKNGAKASAAEAALRHIIKNKSLTSLKQESDSESKMEIEETGEDGKPLPWQQVASFALYKLFCSWGDNPNLITQHVQQSMGLDIPKGEPKPAKKLPDNAAELNPLMLLHQMVPNVHFEEVDKTGVPPNVLFTFRTIVNGTPFSGSGKSKKDARKAVAFEVCQKVFGVQYAPEVLTPAV